MCFISAVHQACGGLRLLSGAGMADNDVKILYLLPGYQRGVIVSGT